MHTPEHSLRPCDAPTAHRRADCVSTPHIRHPTSHIRHPRAFSLVEITIVIIIIAILSAIAVPRFGNSLARYRVDNAAARIKADLSLARDTAIHQSRPITITVVQGAAASYTIVGLRDADRASVANSLVNISREPYFATITGGDTSIVFDGFGVPNAAGNIGLRVGAYTRTVLIDATTGEITVP